MDVESKHSTPPDRRNRENPAVAAPPAVELNRDQVATGPSTTIDPIDGDQGNVAAAPVGTNDWLGAISIVCTVFLAYIPCWYGGFLWDDESHLLNNPVLSPGGLAKVWVPGGYLNYWPLTYTTYWLQFHLWGLHQLGFHLVNLALHALAALLVWRVLVRLKVPGALFAAAIFALHPVNVETAAWIAHLKDILSLVLSLVSMLFYLDSERYASRWRYGLAIATFLLSTLAKGTAVMLPIVLLACAWWQRDRIGWRDLLRVLPYFLIGAVMSSIEVWTQQSVGLGDVVRTDDFFSRLAVAGCALWFYLGKVILPLNLCPIYPRWAIDEQSVLAYLPGVMWLIVLGVAWWKRRTWGRPVVMLMICYAALLLPILGFVNIYFMRFSLVSDHWQYIATIVPCAVFAGVTTTAARRLLIRPAAIAVAISIAGVLGVLTFFQSRTYADAETFYQTVLARNPDCWLAHLNLGMLLQKRGQLSPAIDQYQQALDIKPDYAEAHNDLGNVLLTRKEMDGAMEHFRAALAIKPNYPQALNNLGLVLVAKGDIDLAIRHFQRALEIDPDYVDAHSNLAVELLSLGQFDSAVAHLHRALEINPNYVQAHYNLGNALLSHGQVDAAIAEYQKALALDPDLSDARNKLASALSGRGQTDTAISRDQDSQAIDPNDAEAHCILGNTLLGRGQIEAAIEHYQKALVLNPSYVAAHDNLAVALANRGELDSAIAQFEKSLEIKPDDAVARKNLAVVRSQIERTVKNVAQQRADLLLRPDDAALLKDIAWTLATNPNASVRNGAEAVELAERASKLSGGNDPAMLQTLAAAYAEVGRFADAVQTEERAGRLASSAGNQALVAQGDARQKLYKSGKPYREMPKK